ISPAIESALLMSVSKRNVRQVNILNITPSISSSYLDFFTDQTDLTSLSLGQSSKQQPEKESMSTHIPDHLFEIKSLNLTDFGRIRLSRFPKEAVQAIDEQLLYGKS